MPMSRRSLLLLMATLCLVGCASGPGYHGPVSDHFDGERFHNDTPFDVGWADLWRYYRERDPGPWQRDLRPPSHTAPPARVADGELRVTVVNHATVLLQYDGLNVLTDPIWSERASPLSWLGPQRYVAPGLAFAQLPPIDAVLISHNHYDHLDLQTLRRLDAAHAPLFVVGLGEDRWLRDAGLRRVQALDWGQRATLSGALGVRALPAKHWNGRSLLPGRRNRSLWLAFLIETRGGPVYFAGDTGYGAHFADAGDMYGPFRLALLPIGAYKPRWLTAYQHTSPEDAVRAHTDLRAAQSIGVHFGTFQLSEEGQHEPVTDLVAARQASGLADTTFIAPTFGAALTIPVLPSLLREP